MCHISLFCIFSSGLDVSNISRLEDLSELYLDFARVKFITTTRSTSVVPINDHRIDSLLHKQNLTLVKSSPGDKMEWSVNLLIIEGLSNIVQAVSSCGNNELR